MGNSHFIAWKKGVRIRFNPLILVLALSAGVAPAKIETSPLECREVLGGPLSEHGREITPSTLEAAQAKALHLLYTYAATRASKPEHIPAVVEHPDFHYREQGKELAERGYLDGTLIDSPEAMERMADGDNRAFLILPNEGFIRASHDDQPGRHAALGSFQDATCLGEITVVKAADHAGLTVKMSPRSGSYFRYLHNLSINSYALLGRALQAIWKIGIYPTELVIMDHDTRLPVFTIDLASVRPT